MFDRQSANLQIVQGQTRFREVALGEQITDDAGVVYRPLEGMLVTGAWTKGRVGLIGDAVHATTPHLGRAPAWRWRTRWCSRAT